MSDLVQIVVQFGSLAGIAALIAVIINLLKAAHLVKDGTAGKWSAALNVIALVVLLSLKIFVPSVATSTIDGFAGQAAQVLLVVLGYLVQIFTSSDVHAALSAMNIPLLGKSYSKIV